MLESLLPLVNLSDDMVFTAMLVFGRVGGVAALLPGFGEQSVPMRVRLMGALAFTFIAWPLVWPKVAVLPETGLALLLLITIEVFIGMMIGLAIRMIVMALQLAGSMAAQATSISQIVGAGATPDPMPAIGNALVLSGLALALAAGLHVKAVLAIALSYDIVPAGLAPDGEGLATWGVDQAAHAFELAFALAAPFVLASFAYNLALGFINRAMPQLMVAFIGAPAIMAGGLLILAAGAPALLQVWNAALDAALNDPFGLR